MDNRFELLDKFVLFTFRFHGGGVKGCCSLQSRNTLEPSRYMGHRDIEMLNS